jgi:hypothetical protein
VTTTLNILRRRLGRTKDDRQRGDVPGWVMITIMSAVLVVAVLAVAKTALPNLFQTSVNTVSSQTGDGGGGSGG